MWPIICSLNFLGIVFEFFPFFILFFYAVVRALEEQECLIEELETKVVNLEV